MTPDTSGTPRSTDYLRPIWRRAWMIITAVAVATLGVYWYEARKPVVYTASTLVYYQDPGDPVTGTASLGGSDRTIQDQAVLLDSRTVAAGVARRIGWHGTAQALLGAVSILPQSGEDFIQISAQAGSPRLAAAIVNGFGEDLVNSLAGGVELRIADALKLSQSQLAQTPGGPAYDGQRSLLQAQIQRLVLALHDPATVSRLVDTALPPDAPSEPQPTRNAVFAFVISLIAAVSLAFALERFDRRLRSLEDMEAAFARPLLALVPHASNPNPIRHEHAQLTPEFREPFRAMRTNLELETLDAACRTILVTSGLSREGRSTVVRNLALAYQEHGYSVAVVDLDLRNPSLAQLFGTAHEAGIAEVLRRELTLHEAMVPIPVAQPEFDPGMSLEPREKKERHRDGPADATSNGDASERPRVESIRARPSEIALLPGARTANPSAVLASSRVPEALSALRSHYDIVLIDSAPLLSVSDAVPLLRHADGVLLVARMGVTTRDTAKRLIELLTRLPNLNEIGVVCNDLSRTAVESYGYEFVDVRGAAVKSRLRRGTSRYPEVTR